MKNIVITSAILTLFAGAVSAANLQSRERPDTAPNGFAAAQNVEQVKAASIFSEKELQRAGLMASDTVDVTVFPSTGRVDAPSREN